MSRRERVAAGVLARGLRILGQAVREQPWVFAIGVAGSTGFGLLTIASALVVGAVVGRVVVPALDSGAPVASALAVASAAIVGLSLLKVCAIFARRLGAGAMQYRLQAAYRRRVTRRYLQLPLAWHRRNATGTLLSNANSDVEAAWFPIAPMPFAVGTLLMLLAAIIALLAIDWTFALVGLAIFPALFGLNVIYSRLMSPRIGRAQALRAETSAIAHESFDGALVVKSMGREQEETERFHARARELRDAMISVGRLRGLFDPLADVLPGLGTLAVLLVGVVRLRQGAVGIDEVVSVAFLFTVLAFPARAIGWVLTELPRSVVGWDRVQRVLTATGDMRYGTATLARPGPSSGPGSSSGPGPGPGSRSGPGSGGTGASPRGDAAVSLRFAGVSYTYDGAEAPVLHDVSFDVAPGSTVALVGPTGAGKSTIAALAVRLVDPTAGTVELDGVDVRTLSAASLAATVAVVPQVPFVFDDMVRGNVGLDRVGLGGADTDGGLDRGGLDGAGLDGAGLDGAGLDGAAVWASLRLAQADGFVARLPDGLDAMVGERGATLSGGQRQRLTLARALAGAPRLLVLDDATSAVDPRVEAAILAGLRRAGSGGTGSGGTGSGGTGSSGAGSGRAGSSGAGSSGAGLGGNGSSGAGLGSGCSVLVVAYRRATIALADQVVYLEHGRVVAAGTHRELLATVPGYTNLVTAYERAEAEREREHAYEKEDLIDAVER